MHDRRTDEGELAVIQQCWEEQYKRMLRSHKRFVAIAKGQFAEGSDVARDALFHFFQDAYHVKDWIKNDDALSAGVRAQVEAAVDGSVVLSVCADLCNGSKHRSLTKSRAGDLDTAFVSQSVVVRPPGAPTVVATIGPAGSRRAAGSTASVDAASVWGPHGYTEHSWEVESGGQTWTAGQLADLVVAAWHSWLTEQGLAAPN